MKHILILVFLFHFNSLATSQAKIFNMNEMHAIEVAKSKSKMNIDGIPNEADWQNATAHNFNNYYAVEKKDDRQVTTFKMLWDDTHLYFLWESTDKFITAREKERDGQPYFDDCAEIFLIPTADKINMHFGYEVNLYDASNDFLFINDIYKHENFVVKAYNPEFEVASTVDGTVNDNTDIDQGWKMEMAIPITVFNTNGPVTPIEAGAQWAFMAIRQDRNDAEGNRRSTSTIFPLSSADQNVHNPKNFGIMEFVD